MPTELTVNGEHRTIDAPPETDLATALRRAGYTGVKCGCDGGECGASKVFLDGDVEMACGTTLAGAAGAEVETIASFGSQDDLHPIQQSFVDHFAVQCGFCIPGMIVEAKSLLDDEPAPTAEEVRAALDDNVCRCTGYQKPVEAVLDAADRMRDRSVATDGGSEDATVYTGTYPRGGDSDD